MGALWFVVGLTFVLALTATAVLIVHTRKQRELSNYDRDYRVKLRELENRKAKAINARDDFEAHLADQDAIALRDRYIAKKEL